MIRTKNSPQPYQTEHGITMIRNSNEELGVRFIKADPLEDVGIAYIHYKRDYESIHSLEHGIVGMVPMQPKITIKVAYTDYYTGIHRATIDHILHSKRRDEIAYYPAYSYDKDEGPSDMRYHIFQASDMEFLLINKDNQPIVLFKDIYSGRELVFKAKVITKEG